MLYFIKYVLMIVATSVAITSSAGVLWQPLGSTSKDNDIQPQTTPEYKEEVTGFDAYDSPSYIPNEGSAFRLSMIKKDRKISQLSLVNSDLKKRVETLQRKTTNLSRQLQKTAKISLRKTANSADETELLNQITALEVKIKRIRINDNVRCWKFKGLAKKHNINIEINCKAL